jgi:2-dehydro-3-deoxygluconokinase
VKVVTFGEIMLRLNPSGFFQLFQRGELEASFAGSEANVAVSIANYGADATFVTKVPDNALGDAVIRELRGYGVDTSQVAKGGKRLGIYFVERGYSHRPSKVIYDRENSAIAESSLDDYNWDQVFSDADWFHFSGITPALSKNLAEICEVACRAAKSKGLIVSCDLNYRAKLWSRSEAAKTMSKLMEYVDYLIGNEADASDVFGVSLRDSDVTSGELSKEGYKIMAKELTDRFGFVGVAFSLRGSISATINDWSGMLYVDEQAHFAPKYRIHIVDRIGAGDSFAGALIYALASSYAPQRAVCFAVAASCLKHSIEHDFNRVGLLDIERLMEGDKSGRVQR